MSTNYDLNHRPEPDVFITKIADYLTDYQDYTTESLNTAHYCLMDSLGCAFLALRFPECIKHLGPVVPNTTVPNGSRVPGTQLELDPIKAAWDIGCLIRWLDFNDTWLAAEWGHPSDNLGSILSVTDYLSRCNISVGKKPFKVLDVFQAMIQAHEIQGIIALENSFNRVGLDHVLLVRVASAGVSTKLLGGTKEQIINALSQAWVDGCSLRTYRHAPNAGSRKSWAAGDATSRGLMLAMMTLKGEMGLPSVLTTPKWGFYDVNFKGKTFVLNQDFDCYVMENILFKISFPAEFHAQTAVEAAITLHQEVKNKLEQIEKIEITTHESAIRIISKVGPLANAADRDHCLQYMVACGLIFGNLLAEYYEDDFAKDSRIDFLRNKMEVREDVIFSQDYLDKDKRSIANALQIFFKDGTSTQKITVEYPIGHRHRRTEGIPLLMKKFEQNLKTRFPEQKVNEIMNLCQDKERIKNTSISEFIDMFII